jgi:GT2 family glycosyltransferase
MSLSLAICVATMRPDPNIRNSIHRHPGDISLATSNALNVLPVHIQYNTDDLNLGVVGSYHRLYGSASEDVLAYLHDDVIVREKGWDERVLKEFEDESVAVVGFGGALQHGDDDLYTTPYRLQKLRRHFYRSNVDDAEVHGERFAGSCDVAVLDGYALIVRRSFLDQIGGWEKIAEGADFFCYDYALCALAHRFGYRVRLVGVRCHHRGGGTSVKEGKKGITSQEAYDQSHRWFYEEFREVLPWRCK